MNYDTSKGERDDGADHVSEAAAGWYNADTVLGAIKGAPKTQEEFFVMLLRRQSELMGRFERQMEQNREETNRRFEEMYRYMDKRFEDMQRSIDKRFEDLQRSMDKRFSILKWFIGLGFGFLGGTMIPFLIAILTQA